MRWKCPAPGAPLQPEPVRERRELLEDLPQAPRALRLGPGLRRREVLPEEALAQEPRDRQFRLQLQLLLFDRGAIA